MSDTIKLNGTVTMNANFDGKNVLTLKLTEKSEKRLLERFPADCANYPLNDDTGEFKAHSKYDVGVYEQGEPSGLDISEIGPGTQVCVQVKIASGKYMKKPYKTAYLKAINVLGDVEENVEYNPFDSGLDADEDETE